MTLTVTQARDQILAQIVDGADGSLTPSKLRQNLLDAIDALNAAIATVALGGIDSITASQISDATVAAQSILTGATTAGAALATAADAAAARTALSLGTAAVLANTAVIRTDVTQSLSGGQQTQALANIGAGSAAVLADTAFARTDAAQALSSGQQAQALKNLGLNAYGLRTGLTYLVESTSAPAGTLKKNGALISRTTYAGLWAWVQANAPVVTDGNWLSGWHGAFSSGDGSTTFRLPDNRGEFLRGWDDSRGSDSGRSLGQFQAESIGSHQHQIAAQTGPGGSVLGGQNGELYIGGISSNTGGAKWSGYTGGTETRPRNVPILVCIAY